MVKKQSIGTKEIISIIAADRVTDSIDVLEKIKTMPALESFNEDDLKELLRISKIVRYEPGEMIVDESRYDGWIYYLISGRVQIAKSGSEMAVLQRTGDLFGEVGGMGCGDLSASVVSMDESTCLKIDLSTIEGLPDENRFVFRYVIYRGFAEVLAKRLRITTEKLRAAKEALQKEREETPLSLSEY